VLAALIAAALGTLAAWLVLTQVMHTGWIFLPGAVVLSTGVALLFTLVLGYAGTWRALGTAAAPYLRNE
jgi:putative ABC transport system permease protein